MLLHACAGFPGASRASRGFRGLFQGLQRPPGPPGASRGLRGPPGASRGFQTLPGLKSPKKPTTNNENARLKFHAGWSGWTRPPTMAGGGGRGVLRDLNALRLDASAN